MFTQKEIMNHLREERKKLEDCLEAVKEFVLSRRDDIEKDIENFGMLAPVLKHFIEEDLEAEHSRRIRASLRAEEKAAWNREADG